MTDTPKAPHKIIAGLEEALAFAKGANTGARVTEYPKTETTRLVERLKHACAIDTCGPHIAGFRSNVTIGLALAAADRITALEADKNTLRLALAQSDGELNTINAQFGQTGRQLADMGRERDAALFRVQKLTEAAREACDLLAERTHGSPARSPAHNARLMLESALTSTAPASADPVRKAAGALSHGAEILAAQQEARRADPRPSEDIVREMRDGWERGET